MVCKELGIHAVHKPRVYACKGLGDMLISSSNNNYHYEKVTEYTNMNRIYGLNAYLKTIKADRGWGGRRLKLYFNVFVRSNKHLRGL